VNLSLQAYANSESFGGIGLQYETGVQALYVADSNQFAAYTYKTAPTMPGIPAGLSIGTPGFGLVLNAGAVWGHGVPNPQAYSGPFWSANGSGSPFPNFGLQGSTSSYKAAGGSDTLAPISGDPRAAWGSQAPTSYEVGLYGGLSTPGASVGFSRQSYDLQWTFPDWAHYGDPSYPR
jgi:hypothetical protein